MKFATWVLIVLLSFAPIRDDSPMIQQIKSKLKEGDKAFTIMVTFKVKAEKNEAFEKVFSPCLAASAKEPGCIAYQLNHDPDHPEVYVLYERWKSTDDLAKHMDAEHTKALLAGIADLTDGGPELKTYRVKE